MTGRIAIFILMTEDDTDDRLLVYDAFCESRMANDLLFVQDGMELPDYLNRRNKFTNPQQSPRPGLILLDLNMPRKDECKDLQEIERFKRYGRPFSLIFIDVDHFKIVNDRHERVVGDAILRDYEQLTHKYVKLSDRSARHSGDEFAIILPETRGVDATYLAKRPRRSSNEHDFSITKGTEYPFQPKITVSIGAAEVSEATNSTDGTIAKADRALFWSKSQGRNLIVHGETSELFSGRG
jgi:diguanylate cyclase (GGDEF)-like protein